ncbi:arylesterase [Paracoccus sp. S-4012]|uniref:GDSL-type esterase/lipase family protein n=1 Tax=Paracoccus sp. S-4012 TaxID=2665648 RepID=UPI0012B0E6D4|nr:GDSL-type esterase/lipase family protein [Paracoccus sp. S-4012]MRX49419.1 arylesterase [Paracoccus sp. S-4012]
MDRRALLLAAAGTAVARPLRAEAPLKILVFGDSLVAGYGLSADEGFVPALSRWVEARSRRPVRLIGAGLSGDTSYGGRVRIGWALRHEPDAVIVELGANDMLMRLSPRAAARNLDAILRRAGDDGRRPLLLLGIGAVGPEAFRAAWDGIWAPLAARHGALLVPDLYAVIRAQREPGDWLQADGLHASARGVASMVALAGPSVLELIARAEARR